MDDIVFGRNDASVAALRRDMHRYPETGFLEYRTASRAAARLQALGYAVKAGPEVMRADAMLGVPDPGAVAAAQARALTEGAAPEWVARMPGGQTGVVAELRRGAGPVLAFRFDMDALPVGETDAPGHRPNGGGYRSSHPGEMHACGHDGHAAIGLAVAERLANAAAGWQGTLRLIFQPAEEGGRGAWPMVQAGVLDDVDRLFVGHLGCLLPSGLVAAEATGFLYSTKLDVVFHGVAAHAAMGPQDGRNALLAGAVAVQGLYAISRHAAGATRLNVGRMVAGAGRNIIANRCELQMEVRGADPGTFAYMERRAEEVLAGAAAMHGVTFETEVVGRSNGIVQSPGAVALVAAVAGAMPGTAVVPSWPIGGGDDATFMMQRVIDRGGGGGVFPAGQRHPGRAPRGRFRHRRGVAGRRGAAVHWPGRPGARGRAMITRRHLGAAGLAAAAVPRFAHAADTTAVLAIDADPPTLNLGMTTDYAAGDVGAKVLEGLVWIDRAYAPQPSLAERWTIAPDGKTYTFHLRPGVKWQDGQPFTSADVAWTFTEVLAKLHPRSSAMLKRVAATVDTPDPATVVLHLQQPYAPFMEQLTVFDAPILPRHLYAGRDIATNPANQAPVGTGPFRFASWDRGSALRVARNPAWWGKPGNLDGIVFQIIPQPANRVTGLLSGDVDEVVDFYLPKPDEERLLKDPNLQHREGVNIPAIYFLTFNTARAPFDKLTARQGVAYALDRKRMVAQAMSGLATPGAGAFGDGFAWMADTANGYAQRYPFDTARAASMLAGLGVIPQLLYDAARPQMIATAQIVRENLRAAGVAVQLVPLERSVLIDRVFTRRDFDLTLQSYYSAGDPAIGYHRLYLTENGRPSNTNPSGYGNPEVDRLLGEAATTPERDGRVALYKQAQDILNTDLPSLVLFDEKTADFATRKLTGLWPALDPRDQWGGVGLSA